MSNINPVETVYISDEELFRQYHKWRRDALQVFKIDENDVAGWIVEETHNVLSRIVKPVLNENHDHDVRVLYLSMFPWDTLSTEHLQLIMDFMYNLGCDKR